MNCKLVSWLRPKSKKKNNKNWCFLVYTRGSQPFGTCIPPNQNCTPLSTPIPFAYPQIKNSTQISFIWVRFFEFCVPLWALRVPPVASSRTPRAVFLNLFDFGEPFWPPKKFAEPLPQKKKVLRHPSGEKRTYIYAT
jgi:hypothetical protein